MGLSSNSPPRDSCFSFSSSRCRICQYELTCGCSRKNCRVDWMASMGGCKIVQLQITKMNKTAVAMVADYFPLSSSSLDLTERVKVVCVLTWSIDLCGVFVVAARSLLTDSYHRDHHYRGGTCAQAWPVNSLAFVNYLRRRRPITYVYIDPPHKSSAVIEIQMRDYVLQFIVIYSDSN